MNEQETYSRWLGWGTRVGLGLLAASFALYVAGALPAMVPIEKLPELWSLPAGEYLERTGIPSGWGWVPLAWHGDLLNLAGIALLAGCSIPCLMAVVPGFRARGDRALVWICVGEAVVLLAAASGFISVGH